MPECQYPLLKRDLLKELQGTISFEGNEAHFMVDPGSQGPVSSSPTCILLTCPLLKEYLLQEKAKAAPDEEHEPSTYLEELQRLFPTVWAENNPLELVSHQDPVVVQLLATATPA